MAMWLLAALATFLTFDTKRRLLFTHVPKNAGTSVTDAMSNWVQANASVSASCLL